MLHNDFWDLFHTRKLLLASDISEEALLQIHQNFDLSCSYIALSTPQALSDLLGNPARSYNKFNVLNFYHTQVDIQNNIQVLKKLFTMAHPLEKAVFIVLALIMSPLLLMFGLALIAINSWISYKTILKKVFKWSVFYKLWDTLNTIHAIEIRDADIKAIICCDTKSMLLAVYFQKHYSCQIFMLSETKDTLFTKYLRRKVTSKPLKLLQNAAMITSYLSPNICNSSDNKFDGVVMLTWSNWHTEARSNRYHYATRFAKSFPVLFVMPNSNHGVAFELSGIDNLFLLEIPDTYDDHTIKQITKIMSKLGIKKPLLWIYNPLFEKQISAFNPVLTVFHATEAYFSPDFPGNLFSKGSELHTAILNTLNQANVMISVSEGVEASYLQEVTFTGSHTVITNGCDYEFYAPCIDALLDKIIQKQHNKTVIYQGAIFNKINFSLLYDVISSMPDWLFVFCGKVILNPEKWNEVVKLKNVQYLGELTPEQLRTKMQEANVGIIPFVNDDFIYKRSFPLKAFEYLACGLPTVTVPIESLASYDELFLTADNAQDFKNKLIAAQQLSSDIKYISKIMQAAKQQDYNEKFSRACQLLNEVI